MACCPVLFNPRKKYTVATAPESVRRRWRKQAAETRRRCALAEKRRVARDVKRHYDPEATRMLAPSAPVAHPSIYEEEDAVVGTNPELMVIHNPGHYRRRASSARFTVKHRRNAMKRRRVRKGSYRALVKRLGVKKAARMWRSGKGKRKGSRRRRRNSWHGHRKAHARAARKGWRRRGRKGRKSYRSKSRRKGRKGRRKGCGFSRGAWRKLIKKYGSAKKASRVWRKRKRRCKK